MSFKSDHTRDAHYSFRAPMGRTAGQVTADLLLGTTVEYTVELGVTDRTVTLPLAGADYVDSVVILRAITGSTGEVTLARIGGADLYDLDEDDDVTTIVLVDREVLRIHCLDVGSGNYQWRFMRISQQVLPLVKVISHDSDGDVLTQGGFGGGGTGRKWHFNNGTTVVGNANEYNSPVHTITYPTAGGLVKWQYPTGHLNALYRYTATISVKTTNGASELTRLKAVMLASMPSTSDGRAEILFSAGVKRATVTLTGVVRFTTFQSLELEMFTEGVTAANLSSEGIVLILEEVGFTS